MHLRLQYGRMYGIIHGFMAFQQVGHGPWITHSRGVFGTSALSFTVGSVSSLRCIDRLPGARRRWTHAYVHLPNNTFGREDIRSVVCKQPCALHCVMTAVAAHAHPAKSTCNQWYLEINLPNVPNTSSSLPNYVCAS